MAEKYGVDTLRMAMMFGAPPENDLNFDEKSLQSMKQYLDRVYRLSENIPKMSS
jgi:leucyl-tRNA synthetase